MGYCKYQYVYNCWCTPRSHRRSRPLDKTRMCSHKRSPHLEGCCFRCFLNGFSYCTHTHEYIKRRQKERKETKQANNKSLQAYTAYCAYVNGTNVGGSVSVQYQLSSGEKHGRLAVANVVETCKSLPHIHSTIKCELRKVEAAMMAVYYRSMVSCPFYSNNGMGTLWEVCQDTYANYSMRYLLCLYSVCLCLPV